MSTVAAVWGPFLELQWIKGGLRSTDCGAPQASRFARDRVSAFRVCEVIVECQPKAAARPRRAATGADSLFVQVPLLGLAAHELQGSCRIVKGGLDWRLYSINLRLPRVAVVDGDNGNPGRETLCKGARILFVARNPSAAVDEEQDGSRGV